MPDNYEAWARKKLADVQPEAWTTQKHDLITELLAIPGCLYVDPNLSEARLRQMLDEMRQSDA